MQQALSQRKKMLYSLFVNIMIPLGGVSTDIYLPSLPAIATHFSVHKTAVQFTVTLYAIAMSLGQLIAGPISDALGRKKLLFFSMIMQIIAVLAILFAPSVTVMIVFRFIQGMAAAFMMVPARAILNDIYEGPALKKQFVYITASFAIGLIIAPFIGGYLQHYIGWQANFSFILIYILIVFTLLLLFYQETIKATTRFSIHHLWQNYHKILQNKYFLSYALLAGFAWSYEIVFNVAGPFLIQTEMHQSAIVFGHVALAMGSAWFLGNIASRLLFRLSNQFKTQIALWLTFILTMSFQILAQLGFFSLVAFVVPLFALVFFGGFIFPICVSEALILFTQLAASANACLFTIIWLIVSLATGFAILLKVHSLVPISTAFIGFSLLSLLIYYYRVRHFE